MSRSVDVVIVGSGNVAEAFASAVSGAQGLSLRQIFARNRERGEQLASEFNTTWSNEPGALEEADIYVIAVSDRAVESVAQSLPFARGSMVVHTAGSVPLSVLPAASTRRGIVYAFQSFTQGRRVEFRGLTIFVEAESDDDYTLLESFAKMLESRVVRADSERRKVIHLAGVFVNNFVNHLYASAADILSRVDLDFETLKPLIDETARKALESGDPRMVQTGPAIRGDRAVTERHLEMLRDDETKQQIYKYITESIWETSKKI